ncbi:Abl interactor 2 [Toxocara canis]|uniref:Abl interactor 2 n=1 Tax=Toxocara canis TaxID=6265 RepID=A0A0B2VRY3_TOXCA|nr:Abl interactor 2 [Toxocara canis]
MIDGDAAATLRGLIETEIPEGRASLENSYANLERVAAYCEANYAQAADRKAAFEETKRFTVQSLASVAYQVNTLACALLQTLDLQTEKIANMATQVHNVGEIVAIHKEKVARREIGVLTANKCVQKQAKIVTPLSQERPQRYQRTAIDYSILDGLGHGAKPVEPLARTLISRTASTVSGSSAGAHYPVFPNYEQLLPKANLTATLTRSSTTRSDHYRTPQVASTPVIDAQRLSTLTQGTVYGSVQGSTTGYGTVQTPSSNYSTVQTTPSSNYSTLQAGSNYSSVTTPREMVPLPPPQLASVAQYRLSTNSLDGLPPPPNSLLLDEEPLPPPPPSIPTGTPSYESTTPSAGSYPPPPMGVSIVDPLVSNAGGPFERSVDWIPKVFIG